MALRDVREDDLLFFFEHQREPLANRMACFPTRERDACIAHWRTNVLGCASVIKQTIVVDNEVVGNIVSWEQDGRRLVGYWIGTAFWGRGIATEALSAFVAAHERTRPLAAFVAVRNVGSIRVLEKCGFRRKGAVIEGHDGVDEFLMQLTSPVPCSTS
jgi:RimJ/RimL family protein N-acetyltransferase